MSNRLQISFDDVELGRANQLASSLRAALEEEADGCEVSVVRSEAGTMDFGSTLVLVLGSCTLQALATGVANWLAMKPEAAITLRDERGTVIATGLRSRDVLGVLRAWKESAT